MNLEPLGGVSGYFVEIEPIIVKLFRREYQQLPQLYFSQPRHCLLIALHLIINILLCYFILIIYER